MLFKVTFNLLASGVDVKKENNSILFFVFYRNDASHSSERSRDIFETVCTRPPPTTKVSILKIIRSLLS